MRIARAGLRTASLLLVSTAVVVGLLGSTPAVAAGGATATERVNVRSGPATSYRVLGQLSKGESVTTSGTSDGWTTVTYRSRTGYVASGYLEPTTSAPAAPGFIGGTVRLTTTDLNVRRGAGPSYEVLTVLPSGSPVTVTGEVVAEFAEIVAGSTRGWVSTRYLTAARDLLPAVVSTRVATADLVLRISSEDGSRTVGEVKKGTELAITGITQNGRAQIVHRSAVRWVTTKYLGVPAAILPGLPTLPPVTGTRYATTSLDIRSTSEDAYQTITEVPRGTALEITGVVTNGRMQIIHDGAVRWVTAAYLAKARPVGSVGGGDYAVEKGLKPNAVNVHRAAMVAFPQITTYYGVRPDSIPDHPSGRALDLMVPNYGSAAGKALGQAVADWARANAGSLGIQYVIWDQHIWNIQRSGDGWRFMASRGSDSADHKNHVHITVYG